MAHEMNFNHNVLWQPWRGKPDAYKKAWRNIWDIFDGEGANEYATYVFSPYTSSNRHSHSWRDYFPGEKYVDWVGFNGYNFAGQGSKPYQSFSDLFTFDYNIMRRNLPDTPIMIAATGTDENRSKAKWVTQTFNDLKTDLQGIKAILWWNRRWSHVGISNFNSAYASSEKSLKAFVQGVSDPYFLGAVPYLSEMHN
jgi:beta-mannanase